MRIKALYDWCDCWKKGDIFEVTFPEGKATIQCHDPENGPNHEIINENWEAYTEKELKSGLCPEFEVIEEPSNA